MGEASSNIGDGVEEQFPSLQKLSWQQRRKRVPYVQQVQWTDCGAASLAMVLGYHGREVRLEDVKEYVDIGREGVDALSIMRAAGYFGLRGRGLKLDVQDLKYLPPATILHWDFSHFVVYERQTKKGVIIVDPSYGRRLVPMSQFRNLFTGVALMFETTDTFEAGRSEGKSSVWAYLSQLFKQKHIFSRVLVISFVLRLFGFGLPILTGLIVDRVVPRQDHDLLTVVCVGLGATLVFQMVMNLINAYLMMQMRTNLDTRLTLGFLDHLVRLPYMFFQTRSAGDLLMRVNSNSQIRDTLTSSTLSSILEGGMVLMYLVVLFAFDLGLASIVLVLGFFQICVFLFTRHRYKELTAQGLEARSHSQGYLVQMVNGIETLKISGAEYRSVEHWSNLFVDELNLSLDRERYMAKISAVRSILQQGSPMFILTYGAVSVLDGSMTLGVMLALNALANSFLTPLNTLVQNALQLSQLGGYIDRIDDVLKHDPEQDIADVEKAPQLTGKIDVREVSFRYTSRSPLAVREASLSIDPGMSVAMVGRSGSGKSTFSKLLLGLYPATEGHIFYDGRDLSELDVRSVRRQLGIVPQAPYIFGSSVRENIALTNPNTGLEDVMRAGMLACIHDDIMAMGMGYDSVVADGGASLSGGQKQRLALARALVHGPAILLLDEATSALDARTEHAVMENLHQLNCTRIIIAHRLSTIVNCDLIVVFEEGSIVEVGNHQTLLQHQGFYHQLVSAQTGH